MKTMQDLENELMKNPAYVAEKRKMQCIYDVAQALFAARKRAGLSIGKMAELTELTASSILSVEGGAASMRLSHVIKIANALGLSLHISFSGEPEPESESS